MILITTKNGNAGANAEKGFEISFTQQVSAAKVANLPDYQDTYSNGFSGDFGWFFSNWGPSFDTRGSNGIADDGTINHPYDQAHYNDDSEFAGARYVQTLLFGRNSLMILLMLSTPHWLLLRTWVTDLL